MQSVLNRGTFKHQFGGGRFHMLPQSYKLSLGLCLNSFTQVWLISNQRYQVPLFRYINQSDKVSHLVVEIKKIKDIIYFMRSFKIAVDVV